MLTEKGYPEVAYKIATQETYPAWGLCGKRGNNPLGKMGI